MERGGASQTVVGIGEVPRTPWEGIESEEGEGGASDEIRTAMKEMDLGGEEIDKVEEAEVEKDDV